MRTVLTTGSAAPLRHDARRPQPRQARTVRSHAVSKVSSRKFPGTGPVPAATLRRYWSQRSPCQTSRRPPFTAGPSAPASRRSQPGSAARALPGGDRRACRRGRRCAMRSTCGRPGRRSMPTPVEPGLVQRADLFCGLACCCPFHADASRSRVPTRIPAVNSAVGVRLEEDCRELPRPVSPRQVAVGNESERGRGNHRQSMQGAAWTGFD